MEIEREHMVEITWARLQLLNKLTSPEPLTEAAKLTLARQFFKTMKTPERDAISHHVFRHSFCEEPYLRWFVRGEKELMRLRAKLKGYRLGETADKPKGFVDWQDRGGDFTAVPWTHVLPLVAKRKVVVHKGLAYVHVSQTHAVIAGVFAHQLKLDIAKGKYPMDLDSMAGYFILYLRVLKDMDAPRRSLALAKLKTEAFPPCMVVDDKAHLKHEARLQKILFLRAVGLNLMDCHAYIRKHHVRQNQELSQYAEHAYAKGYKPYGCSKIATCPYKGHNANPRALCSAACGRPSLTTINPVQCYELNVNRPNKM